MDDVLQSVLGPVPASTMHWIHPHEHLVCAMNEWNNIPIDAYPGQLEYARRQLLPALTELKQYGVTGLVDPLPQGIGRDATYARLARSLSEESGLSIFLATGLYAPQFWPAWGRQARITELADLFTREMEEGIGDTGIRACFLKQAVGGAFTTENEKALTAAAIAQRRTGVSVHVHATGCRREIVELLTGLDVPASRIYIAHADMNTSQEEFLWLAAQGVRLVMTNWDFSHHMDQDEARRLLRLLIDEGYIDNVLVSIDFYYNILDRWFVGIGTWSSPDRTSYAYLHTAVLPKLQASGVTESQIDHIMGANPIQMLRRA
ncbi:MAG: phosphotriesterase family protein [Anaerolineae bacterium]